MNSNASQIHYTDTGFFSTILTDYVAGEKKLHPFFQHSVSLAGIKAAIESRKKFNTNRSLLSSIIKDRYASTTLSQQQQFNIEQLSNTNTFTITTAHQPNIFSGHLYFIYKILHTIKLAEMLCVEVPTAHFVPVYYMGSEDADLDELGHIFINEEKYEWKTTQTGAVGRMKVDKALTELIDLFAGQLLVHPHGKEIVSLMKKCYTIGITIEQATFTLVNELFAGYGLLILQPDDARLKKEFAAILQKELLEQFSHKAVAATVSQFPSEYKVQASGRDLNLFYLQEGSRQRIEMMNNVWSVVNTALKFSKDEILEELESHPERFSPNVILRPIFQEMILPNIAFIGGGGELAYWLELKKVFEEVAVPFPMLVVRNSFLIIEKQQNELLTKLQLTNADLFKPTLAILNDLVKKISVAQIQLTAEKQALQELYEKMKTISGKIDVTLVGHTSALQNTALKKIEALEKKMIKAERKKFEAEQRQIKKIKSQLFPNNNLQERTENFMLLYAKHGIGSIDMLYKNSLAFEQQFTIIEC